MLFLIEKAKRSGRMKVTTEWLEIERSYLELLRIFWITL